MTNTQSTDQTQRGTHPRRAGNRYAKGVLPIGIFPQKWPARHHPSSFVVSVIEHASA